MRVAALSLAGSRAQGLTEFMEELEKLLRGLDVRLAVLPLMPVYWPGRQGCC